MRNPDFDPDRFAADMRRTAPADRCYLMLFTPRSGSTWITKTLNDSGRFGYPGEFLNEAIVEPLMTRHNAPTRGDLIALLRRKTKTANGVFGVQATAAQLALFGEDTLFEALPKDLSTFVLWRRDIVAQGVSLYRATASGRFHSFMGEAAGAPPYDAGAIRFWINHVLNIENMNCLILERRRLRPIVFDYEAIAGDREATLAIFGSAAPTDAAAGRRRRPAQPHPVEKVGDSWNGEAAARFKTENGRFVRAVEAQRLTPRWTPGAPSLAFRAALVKWRARRGLRGVARALGLARGGAPAARASAPEAG